LKYVNCSRNSVDCVIRFIYSVLGLFIV
jgi:hypothetical protein